VTKRVKQKQGKGKIAKKLTLTTTLIILIINNQAVIKEVVAPAGIEPASSESESEILSIVLRSHISRS
jgi:hypothetical protein